MAWRDGEVWLDADLLWFREQRQGALGVPSLALAGATARFDPPGFGPVATGLEASRRRRLEAKAARRRRLATRTVPAVALVLGSATMLPIAALRQSAGQPGPLDADPPSLTFRLQDFTFRPLEPPVVRKPAAARVAERPARRVESRDLDRPSVRRQPGRRHAAARRGARLGHLEPRDGQQPEPARPALGSRAHDPCGHLRAGRVSRRAPRRTSGRRG